MKVSKLHEITTTSTFKKSLEAGAESSHRSQRFHRYIVQLVVYRAYAIASQAALTEENSLQNQKGPFMPAFFKLLQDVWMNLTLCSTQKSKLKHHKHMILLGHIQERGVHYFHWQLTVPLSNCSYFLETLLDQSESAP